MNYQLEVLTLPYRKLVFQTSIITNEPEAQKIYKVLKERFPESDGFVVDVARTEGYFMMNSDELKGWGK